MEQRALEICQRSLVLPPAARPAFVHEACAGDHSVHELVVSLLENLTQAQDPIPTAQPTAIQPADLSGSRLGGYQLERILGVGGMGTVYLATREQSGITGRFALKTINASMPDGDALARFREEQRALARLRHPYIASFVELGNDRVPFYVMEYVDGQPISAYCDEHALNVRGRIELWLKVCDALRYSHRQLIVHRDIKPGNILVTENGVPKLLDFGIAKFLRSDAGVEQTQVLGARLTVDYASPERLLRGQSSALEDQYALGVLLYRLITGRLPFQRSSRTLQQLAEHIDREQAPAMAERFLAAEENTQQMQLRHCGESRRNLLRALRSDLNAIVLKALHPDAERRYASIDALHADVSRYLAGLPVSARPDEWHYRLRRFVSRHKAPVVAASAAVAILIASLAFSLDQTHRAEEQLQRAQSIAAFLNDIITAPSTRWTSTLRVGNDASMRDILTVAAARLATEESIDVATRAELHMSLSVAMYAWDLPGEAISQNERALQLAKRALPPEHPVHAQARTRLSMAYDMSGREDLIARVPGLLDETSAWIAQHAPENDYLWSAVHAEYGYNHALRGNFRQAADNYQLAVEQWLRAGGDDAHPRVMLGYGLWGQALEQVADYEGAMARYAHSVQIHKALDGPPPQEWAIPHIHLLKLQTLRRPADEALATAISIMNIAPQETYTDPQAGLLTYPAAAFLYNGYKSEAAEIYSRLQSTAQQQPENLHLQASVDWLAGELAKTAGDLPRAIQYFSARLPALSVHLPSEVQFLYRLAYIESLRDAGEIAEALHLANETTLPGALAQESSVWQRWQQANAQLNDLVAERPRNQTARSAAHPIEP